MSGLRRAALAVAALALTASMGSIAAIRYVDAITGVDAGACAIEANPCRTITYAMASAVAGNPGDAIRVAGGTYNKRLGETFPIVVKSGVQLQSGAGAFGTRIDASGVYERVFNASGVNAATLIQGFYITGGQHRPAPDGTNGQGGAILIDGQSQIAIRGNIIANNQARGFDGPGANFTHGGQAFGGAIASFNSSPIIENNVFRSNSARGGDGYSSYEFGGGTAGNAHGGALYLDGGAALVVNNTFLDNVAQGGRGGAFRSQGGEGGDAFSGAIESIGADIVNNIFVGNTVVAGVGGAALQPEAPPQPGHC